MSIATQHNTLCTYSVTFSSTVLSVTTTVSIDTGDGIDYDDCEEHAIDLAAERMEYELGFDYAGNCHSVNVELLSEENY